jgi:hypothetical protein
MQEESRVKDLSQSYNVRSNTLSLKSPKVTACAPKTSLHLICNAEPSSLSYNIICSWQISRRKLHCSTYPLSYSLFSQILYLPAATHNPPRFNIGHNN